MSLPGFYDQHLYDNKDAPLFDFGIVLDSLPDLAI